MSNPRSAEEAVLVYLRTLERETDNFGSALPENVGRPKCRLAIARVDEHDFGWVYFYNSAEYLEKGNFEHSLVGNAPLIVDRTTLRLYSAGTAKPIGHYVEEFRRGVLRPIQ
jgi:hypothetical protein